LTLSPDKSAQPAKSRTNLADPDPDSQANLPVMACSQIDYYRSATTIAATLPFNQAATIHAGVFPLESLLT
jgi:hypothetical protein